MFVCFLSAPTTVDGGREKQEGKPWRIDVFLAVVKLEFLLFFFRVAVLATSGGCASCPPSNQMVLLIYDPHAGEPVGDVL